MTTCPQSLIDIEAFARDIHKDDKRWGGEPYITHPEWMANHLSGYYRKATAWLHDTVEDHPNDGETMKSIRDRFGPLIADYVDILTHRDVESYDDYIARIGSSQSRVAMDVKMMDLTHNMRGLKPGARLDKYQGAYRRLEVFAKKARIE